jgi:uncharacterized protein YbbK (DUF523 family)
VTHLDAVYAALERLPEPTPDRPWPILISGCMAGWPTGIDGTDYGMGKALLPLRALPTARIVAFCPEDTAFGTPRRMPDLHGGNGQDALDGRARFLFDDGTDGTEAMIAAADRMVELAKAEEVVLAVLTDMSAACGTQVISDGCRFDEPRRFQRGPGVAAAALMRAGVPVMAQRDYKALHRLLARLDPKHVPDPAARDHHDSDWVRSYFAV